jgi:predicted lipid-binding transport protein (Tim44 family)
MVKKNCSVNRLAVFSLFLMLFFVLDFEASARIGGGRSFGSSGSRSFSMPRSPSSTPGSPSRQFNTAPSGPTGAPLQQPQSGGFLRGIAGGIVGGMIGGMLFRSLGFGGLGGAGGGIGLFDYILIGLILYGIWWFIKKKKQEKERSSNPDYYRETSFLNSSKPSSVQYNEESSAQGDVETGLGFIRQMDASFIEQKFTDLCMDNFFKVQGAWANRDMLTIRNLLTDEMYGIIQADADELKRNRKINHLDNIAVRSLDITEAWQESGKDFITVKFYANLLDYDVDEVSGRVVSGSKTDPVKFEEYWTFTRPVGNNPWRLSAITQAQV